MWSFENRVGKLVFFLTNFSQLLLSNSLFIVLFADVLFLLPVLWLRNCVEVDVEGITIFHSPPNPPPSDCPYFFVPIHSSLVITSDSLIFDISARLKLVSVPFGSLLL